MGDHEWTTKERAWNSRFSVRICLLCHEISNSLVCCSCNFNASNDDFIFMFMAIWNQIVQNECETCVIENTLFAPCWRFKWYIWVRSWFMWVMRKSVRSGPQECQGNIYITAWSGVWQTLSVRFSNVRTFCYGSPTVIGVIKLCDAFQIFCWHAAWCPRTYIHGWSRIDLPDLQVTCWKNLKNMNPT